MALGIPSSFGRDGLFCRFAIRHLVAVISLAASVCACGLLAQEPLTNDSILKLVRAGMSEDVILGVVSSQPGKFSLSTDDVIALKHAGVSDKVLSAMLTRSGSVPATALATSPVSALPLQLHDGTPVRLRLTRNLSSADATTGDTIDFEVIDDVKIDDVIVIARGEKAIGSITDAEHKKRMARGGKLDVALEYVRLVDDEKVALRAVQGKKGGGHAGAMTGAMVATAIVVWPAAPFFLFMHGKDATIPKGTEVIAYTDGEIILDRAKFPAKTQAPDGAPETPNTPRPVSQTALSSAAVTRPAIQGVEGIRQVGRVLDSKSSKTYLETAATGSATTTGTISSNYGSGPTLSASTTASVRVHQMAIQDTQLLIVGREYAYVIDDPVAKAVGLPTHGIITRSIMNRGHGCRFIVGEDVSFTREKQKLVVIDADGKECKLEIIRQERLR